MIEVRLLKPEELGLTNKIQKFEDGLRTEPKSGSYEWWYFDSKYPDGSSLVIIFYTKHVTSFAKKFKPFVSLNYINPNGKELRTELWSDDYSFQRITVTSESESAMSRAIFLTTISISKTRKRSAN